MKSISVKVSGSGRLNLPAEVRKVLGLKGPGHIIVTMDDGAITIKTMAQALDQLRALARPYAPKDHLASEELIAERRAEAQREDMLETSSAGRARRSST